jgi:drug/metabolite transporter (DMT)-like permease
MSTNTFVKRPLIGHIALISSLFLFASNGSVSKALLISGIDTAKLAQIRVTGAFAFLIILAFIFVRPQLKLRLHEIPKFMSYGIVGIALVQYLYFVAISRLDIGVALVIEYTAPVLVALWARFGEKEPVRKRVWLALAITIAGLSLVTNIWSGFTLDSLGVLAASLAAIALAVYFITGEKLVTTRSPLAVVTLAFGASVVFWAVFEPWWNFDIKILQGETSLFTDSSATLPTWTLISWMIVMGTIAPFFLSFVALRHLKARTAAIVGTLEPVTASAIAFVLLNESLLAIQLLGGVAVIGGVILAETAREK